MRYLFVPILLLAGCAHNTAVLSMSQGPSYHESQTRIQSSVDQMCSHNNDLCPEIALDHVPSPGPFLPEP